MTSVCFYFQVHQPFRLNWFWPDTGVNWKGSLTDLYFDRGLNEFTFKKVAGKCYHRSNDILLSQIDRFKNSARKFKVSFSLSGTFLDQCERWDRDLLEKFKQMAESGCVEFLCETYYHSLASLYEDKTEFIEQIKQHQQVLKDLLGVRPKVFRNTELLYHNDIGKEAEELGFQAIMTEGIERILEGWKSPNFIYRRHGGKIKILLRNYQLSDDIGYRFSSRWWNEYPLTADKYATWLSATPGDTINIFIDYETFGEHHWEDTGIFWFLGSLPQEILKWQNLEFSTPSEVVDKYQPVGEINVPYYETVSWADLERDASAWLGNHMQQAIFNQMKRLGDLVKESGNDEFIKIWRYLQTGDHFYYMCTKCLADGDVHKYFSHHGNPYDAGINYLTILSDFKERVLRYTLEKGKASEKIKKAVVEETASKSVEVAGPEKVSEKIQLIRARKYILGDKYTPKSNEIIVGKPKSTGFISAVLTQDSQIIKGRRLTPEEKYAPKSTESAGSKKQTPNSSEVISAVNASKNSQIIHGKRITPEEKYKPRSSDI